MDKNINIIAVKWSDSKTVSIVPGSQAWQLISGVNRPAKRGELSIFHEQREGLLPVYLTNITYGNYKKGEL